MNRKRIGFLVAVASLFSGVCALAQDEGGSRSAYSYIREMRGEVTVNSRWNGRVEARRNLPISAGDEILVGDGGRAEIALADGNLLHVGGGTRARFDSLRAQEGEDADFSSIELQEGSVILSVLGADEQAIPRVDTEDATVYLGSGARVRINSDPRRGTVVIARQGSAEVRTRVGSHTVRSGSYLMVRAEEEPEIARGAFSRDRFDLWAADRTESLYESPPSASARYVDKEYESDVVALDGYGDWSYSNTYSTNVWRPRVSVGWTPYSYGSWYYTPIGLTWWSYDPWGWYPFHYGSWYFDAGWSRWSWLPAHVYSPAWVYWAYTPSYVGWCPIGYYSFYSPWFHSYYRNWGLHRRGGLYFSIHGSFPTRTVDFRGWNFVNAGQFGATAARMEVVPGSRIAGRIGGQVAISSRPIVVSARRGSAREAVREFVREAPRVIERSASPDSSRMAPVLARERTLPEATVSALRERVAVTERGRLSGPGARDVAPRAAVLQRGRGADGIVSRPRGLTEQERSADRPDRPVLQRGRPSDTGPDTPRAVDSPAPRGRAVERPQGGEPWRGRGSPPEVSREAPNGVGRPDRGPVRPSVRAPRARNNDEGSWRGRTAPQPPALSPRSAGRDDSWRRDVPPARRIIEGSIPGRRAPAPAEAPRGRQFEGSRGREVVAPAREPPPRPQRSEPPPRVESRSRPSSPPPPPRAQSRPSSPPPARADRGRPKH